MTSRSDQTAPDVPVGVVPYLAVGDARAALEWYARALGAREASERYDMPDGRIGHAELEVHGALFYLADPYPEHGLGAPRSEQPRTFSLVFTVPDTDAAVARAVDAGATFGARAKRQPVRTDRRGGRSVRGTTG